MTNICPSCLHENTPSDRFCIVCGTPLTPPLGPYLPSGTLLKQGEYKIESVLGQGAFGITYKAVYCPNQARVAIKELWAENGYRQGTTLVWPYSISPVSQREQIKKFILEAANLQRCVSPHIAKVYDCFRENLTIYMVMELIDGVTLSKMIENYQNISETRGINYIIQIAKALDLVHQNNILHRDIKPENILINSGDRAVLIDFGTAREFIAGKTGDMTRILTAEYAPIEQYLSQSKRYEATDIYALCASLYELLTGQLPSASLDRAHSLSSGLPDPLIPPRQINPNISPDVEEVILRGMCHNVSDRVQTARELIDALGGETSSTPPPTAPPQPRLIAKQINAPRSEFLLNGVVLVGISNSDDSSVDIQLHHFVGSETVSRRHAKIYPESGGLIIKDLGSTNGTFIKPKGQTRFSARITTPTRLNSDDEIAFGRVRFVLKML